MSYTERQPVPQPSMEDYITATLRLMAEVVQYTAHAVKNYSLENGFKFVDDATLMDHCVQFYVAGTLLPATHRFGKDQGFDLVDAIFVKCRSRRPLPSDRFCEYVRLPVSRGERGPIEPQEPFRPLRSLQLVHDLSEEANPIGLFIQGIATQFENDLFNVLGSRNPQQAARDSAASIVARFDDSLKNVSSRMEKGDQSP
jgi:hypothetical protein